MLFISDFLCTNYCVQNIKVEYDYEKNINNNYLKLHVVLILNI